jgi:hypothetical protein
MSNGSGEHLSGAMAEAARDADHAAATTRIEGWFHEGLSVMVYRDCVADDTVSFRLVLAKQGATEFEQPIPIPAYPAMRRIFMEGGSFAAAALQHMPSAQASLATLSSKFAAFQEKDIFDGSVASLEAGGFERKGRRI